MLRHTIIFLAVAALAFGASPSALRPRVSFSNGRIVGGQDASVGEFPYQVSLQLVILVISSHSCGGSIISPTTILTAAHCITEVPNIGYYKAVAGDHNLNVEEGTEQGIRVDKSIVHPDYQGGVAPNDVAVMLLRSPLTFNARVGPIALPTPGAIPQGQAVLSGWGSVSTSLLPTLPAVLQTALVPIVPMEECKAAVGSEAPLASTNVCTGPLTGGLSACSGDSGGPLAQNGTVIGIVSWGYIPCGSVNAPSVFTRVSAFVDWIKENGQL